MIVKINSGGKKLTIPCPLSVALISVKAALKAEEGVDLPVTELFREIRRMKQVHPDWVLAEVETTDGQHVIVKM